MLNSFSHLMSSLTLAVGLPGPMEMAFIAIIVLVLFGNRLPGAAKSLGQSFTAFKKGIKEGADDEPEHDNDKI